MRAMASRSNQGRATKRTLERFWRGLRRLEAQVSAAAAGADLAIDDVWALSVTLEALQVGLNHSGEKAALARQRAPRTGLEHIRLAASSVLEHFGGRAPDVVEWRTIMATKIQALLSDRTANPKVVALDIGDLVMLGLHNRAAFGFPSIGGAEEFGDRVEEIAGAVQEQVNAAMGRGRRKRSDPVDILNSAMRVLGLPVDASQAAERKRKSRTARRA